MSITIGRYQFEGPYDNTGPLRDRGGVYAILCRGNSTHHVTDIGESATVKTRIEHHDRRQCWIGNCRSSLLVAVLYTLGLQQPGRQAIEQELRTQYNPPCGAW